MQNTFALRVKKTVQKVAAVGVGVAMMGASMTGALALDYTLGDYPTPFIQAKKFNNVAAIMGDQSTNDDNTALSDVLSGLTAATATVGTGGQLILGGDSKVEDLQVGIPLNDTTDGFGTSIDDDDVDGFQDTTMRIDINDVSDDYDISDQIQWGTESPTIHTGLSFDQDEDWQDKVFVTVPKASVKYRYSFDTSLKAGNELGSTSATDSVTLNFLGQDMEIQSATNSSITVNTGERFDMSAGDSVVVEGKTVTLVATTGTNKATIDVDGVREVVTENNQEIINGLEIRVEDVADEEGIEFDSATLFIGIEAREKYTDGKEYTGEDENNPAWVWDLGGVNETSTPYPTLGVRFDLALDSPVERDNPAYEHPIYIGESLCLPRDYACIVFDSLTIDDYLDYEIRTGVTETLYNDTASANANIGGKSTKVLEFRAIGVSDSGFKTTNGAGQSSGPGIPAGERNKETDTILISAEGDAANHNAFVTLGFYREMQDSSKAVWFMNITSPGYGGAATATEGNLSTPFVIDYKDTTFNVDVQWWTLRGSGANNNDTFAANMTLNLESYSGHGNTGINGQNRNITIEFRNDGANSTNINFLGSAESSSTDTYLLYGTKDISGFSEDTRSPTGIIIRDPDGHRSSDNFEMSVPSDIPDFKANIVATTSGRTINTGGEGSVTDVAPQIVKANDVTVLSNFNAILGGGPCVNKHVAALKGLVYPACGSASGFTPNTAIIELMDNGNNVALIVAGWEAPDTKRAGVVLKNYDDTSVMSALAGKTAVSITGTTQELSGITIA